MHQERTGQPPRLPSEKLLERRALHGRLQVFEDRMHAGRILAEMLRDARIEEACLLAIPAGGVPVAAAMARELGWPLDVAVVSKITLPWNREAGYGAVAFDGTVLLNHELIQACGLSADETSEGIAITQRKVRRRVARLRGDEAPPQLHGRAVVLVDDGLASGFTMRAAVAACRNAGAVRIAAAVPTAHSGAIERLLPELDLLVCANVRSGTPFAVADAYVSWQDVVEAQAELELEQFAHGCDATVSRTRREPK